MSEPPYKELCFLFAEFSYLLTVRIGSMSEKKLLPDKDAASVTFIIKCIRQWNAFAPYTKRVHIGILHHLKKTLFPLRLITMRVTLQRVQASAKQSHLFPIDSVCKRHVHHRAAKPSPFQKAVADLPVLPQFYTYIRQVLSPESPRPPQRRVLHLYLFPDAPAVPVDLRPETLHFAPARCSVSVLRREVPAYRQMIRSPGAPHLYGEHTTPILLHSGLYEILLDLFFLIIYKRYRCIYAYGCEIGHCPLVAASLFHFFRRKIMYRFSDCFAAQNRSVPLFLPFLFSHIRDWTYKMQIKGIVLFQKIRDFKLCGEIKILTSAQFSAIQPDVRHGVQSPEKQPAFSAFLTGKTASVYPV